MHRGWLERWRGLAQALGPPLVALALAESLLWAGAVRNGEDPRNASTWVRWDSYRYIEIARGGYLESRDDPEASNTGWFPGFPLVMRLASRAAHVTPARAGRSAALGFELALLTLLWNRLLPPVPVARRLLALLAAACFPAWFYRHAVFPLSMTTFFNLAAIELAAAGAFVGAGACGALSAFTYPTGFLVAVPLALAAALARGRSSLGRLRAAAAGAGLTLLGLGAVFAVLQVGVGRWDAFLVYQQRFGQGLHSPLEVLLGHTRPLLRGSLEPAALVSSQTVLVTALWLLGAWLLWRDREAGRPVDLLLLAHGAAVWVFVNGAGPNVSIYRQAAVLVGLAPLVARLRLRALVLLLVLLLGLGVGMVQLFFSNQLV
ncbi:MAG TPA: hypothetical protein VJ648_02385 [Vicinamibacteria bacterium]|nr:hypothetical protein [Vicinamibacteria bacterium]